MTVKATGNARLHMSGSNSSWTDYRDVLARFQPFTTSGALHGTPKQLDVHAGTGILPEPWKSQYESDPMVVYVVYSYATPIAWYSDMTCEWVIPDVKYSITTTGHQSTIRTAISQIGK